METLRKSLVKSKTMSDPQSSSDLIVVKKLSKSILVFFKPHLHTFTFPKKSSREGLRAILTTKTEILLFRHTFSRERYTTFLTSVTSISDLPGLAV